MKCPCHSGRRYSECCGPIHRGAKIAETPEQLMRSRYAAFARGDTGYLVKSQAKSQTGDAASYRTERTVRFLDLAILHTSVDGDRGEVLFYARLYERGVDRSFVELSDFVREDGEWRYASGVTLGTKDLPADPRTLTRDDVLRMNAAG